MSEVFQNTQELKEAAEHLKLTYERRRLQLTPKRRRDLSWIPLLPEIVSHAGLVRWEELKSVDQKKLLKWAEDLDAINTDQIPSVDEVYCDRYIGPLIARSFAFYLFYLDATLQEAKVNLEDIHLNNILKFPASERAVSALKSYLNNARQIEKWAWESEKTSYEMRRGMYFIIGAHTDPSFAIEAIRKAANAKAPAQSSLGHRQAPMGPRQSGMYYGHL
ncbi:uncharacterized protein JCM6883_001425 [Sporobolomyces salmoneus]|uniref:uncharacterized protein n=1 Tax=Sporobolomyces salmoneus TaxID=183962 RepID=UPI00316C49E3